MRDGYRVFDADRHVIEPFDLWGRYLDPAFRAHAPVMAPDPGDGPAGETLADRVARLGPVGAVPLMPRPLWDGRPIWRPMPEATRRALAKGSWDRLGTLVDASSAAGQLAVMDRQGIDRAALVPTYASYLVSIDEMPPPVAHAFGRAYNRWLADLCSDGGGRLIPVGLIARHDPEAMVAELDRLLARGGRAVVMRPEPVGGRTLSHPDHDPFWARCAEAGVAVVLHGGTHVRLPTAGFDRFETRFGLHACSHPLEQMMALVSLVEGGVFARFPALRFAILEAGCTWLPHWLWRLDEVVWPHAEDIVRARVPEPPSNSIRRQCVIAFEPGEALLAETVEVLGADRLLFGSDFPHLDHAVDVVDDALALTASLGGDAMHAMLYDNAARLFGAG